jgi:hypothetical protein
MAKYVLIYNGGKAPESEEEKDRVMTAWGHWFESLGDALVDGGNPFGSPKSIGGDASEAATGYSVLQADDHDAAVELAKGNPMTQENGTRIDVYEAFPM